jgi:Ca2+-binding RTX toxin-like protein
MRLNAWASSASGLHGRGRTTRAVRAVVVSWLALAVVGVPCAAAAQPSDSDAARQPQCHGRAATIVGMNGDDVIAGPGNDSALLSGTGSTSGVVVHLQDGQDTVHCEQSCAGDAVVYGDPRSNEIDTRYVQSVTITLGHIAFVLAPTGLDIFDFDRASTGVGADTVLGSARDDIITRQGADHIDGGDGVDTVNAGGGQDTCVNVEHATSCEAV